jgi:DNA-binding CsgD family transcriptional regulator/tetratricopeptide (TPR) repeat protein
MLADIVWPLVGRDEELALIADVLGGTVRRGVVIAGDAGAGKTRLALEVLSMARRTGLAGMRVMGSRAAATVPLGVFAPLLPTRHAEAAGTFEGLQWAAEALVDRAEGRRMVLVVDDAHDLDAASATLVQQLAVEGPVFVVATVRSGEPAPDAVVALWKDGLAPRLELQVLSRDETAELLALALPGEVDVATSHQLWVASGGNPLFLRELVLAAMDGNVLAEESGVWTLNGPLQVPPSIQELVRQRLTLMNPSQRDLLYALAFADALGLGLMHTLHPEADVEALERRGLIRLDDDGRRRPAALTHPMYGEVLRAEAPGTTAVTVAQRLTTAVEGLGARRREDALRVATWRLVIGGKTQPGLLETAAQQAYHAADFPLAERLARAALATAVRPAATVLLAQVVDERGEHAETEALLASIEPGVLPPTLRTRAALTRADNLFFGLGREQEAQQVLADAVQASIDAPTGELMANSAWIELHTGRPRAALERVAAVSPADPRGSVAAGIVTAWATALLGDTAGALHAAAAAAAREQTPPYPAVSRHGGFPELARGLALLHAGRLDEAEEAARSGLAAALSARPLFLQARWTALLGAIVLERGAVVTAASTFRQAAALQRRLGQVGLLRANLSGQALAAAQAGAVPEALTAIQELDELARTPERLFDADVLSARAWLAAAQGELSKAARLLRDAAAAAQEAELVTIEARVQHDLVRLGEVGDAAVRLAHLANHTDSAAADARALHAAAAVDGTPERLEGAATTFEQLHIWLLAAEAFMAAAVAYANAGRRRAHACRHRAAALHQRCEGARTPAVLLDHHAAPLTPREREVVTMAANGLSSRAIAERLVISVRTVDNLIQRAYIKLGVHNRPAAAEALGLAADRPPGSADTP